MNKRIRVPFYLKIYNIVFLALLLAYSVYTLFFTDITLFEKRLSADAMDLNEGWMLEDGTPVNINDVSAGTVGGKLVIHNTIPDNIEFNNELCFSSNNADVTVRTKDGIIFEFHTEKNLTGHGYGIIYHTVNLDPDDAGGTVWIELEDVVGNRTGGRIGRIMICDAPVYRSLILQEHFLSYLVSLFIMFAGWLLLILNTSISKKRAIPYNLPALGLALVLIGIWLLGDCGIPQLLSRHYMYWHVIDYLLLPFAVCQLLAFIISFMKVKRWYFNHLTFIIPFMYLIIMIGIRTVFDIDMSSLAPVVYVSNILIIILTVLIITDNEIYCKKNNKKSNLTLFYAGLTCLGIGILLDIIVFAVLQENRFMIERGNFTRIGIGVFVILMLVSVMRWWTNEQIMIRREMVINRITKYAMSAGNCEQKIKTVLEYLGSELRADRAYIFEETGEGLFDNTYEWCKEGVSAEIDNLQKIPYEGIIEDWYNEYKKDENVLIYDLEEYRSGHEKMYQILKPQGINTLITAPVEINGEYVGFYGVDNPPRDMMDEISNIVGLLSFFISQLISQKTYENRLLRYSYYDSLTGVRNRHAMREFERTSFDPAKPYGYIMCDINGLKITNDTMGHEAGDEMIKDVTECLASVFGLENTYRMGGDEFAVYDCDIDEAGFAAKITRLRELISAKNRSVSIGAVYNDQGPEAVDIVKSDADAKMYDEKRRYYEGRNDRRRWRK